MSATLPLETPRASTAGGDAVLSGRGRMSFGLLLRLAVADLWHERALTACVVVALTAVLAPLLILFSLKYGLVETMRTRLVNDPRNREVRPEQGHTFTYAQVQELGRHPGIRFVIPNTRSISSSVDLSISEEAKETVDADLLPTGPNDPLLEENGARIPGPGECVLSHRAWKSLAPDREIAEVYIKIGRTSGKDKSEHAGTPLKVVGVTQERATDHVIIFTPLEFLESVEAWRDGRAVPEFEWPGGSAEAAGVTDAVIVAMPRAMEGVERSELRINAPWVSEVEELTQQQMQGQLASLPAGMTHYYHLATSSKRHEPAVDDQAILALRRSLPDDAGGIYAKCRPLVLQIASSHGGSAEPIEFEVEPLLVNEPTKRSHAPVSPRLPPPAPPRVAAPAPVANPEVPKAIPIPSPAAPAPSPPAPKIVLPEATTMPPFDFRQFNNQLRPPPPSPSPAPRGGETPKKGGSSPTPAKPKNDRSTGLPPLGLWVPPTSDSGHYIQLKKKAETTPSKKTTTKPVPAKSTPATSKSPGSKVPAATKPVPKQEVRRAAGAPAAATPSPSSASQAPRIELDPPRPTPSPREPAAPVIIQGAPSNPRPPVKPELVLFLPAEKGIPDHTRMQASLQTPFGPVTFPVTVRVSAGGEAKMPQSLAGVLRLGMDRGIAFEEASSSFVLSRRGYPALRIVARTIDDVEAIAQHFGTMQVGVMTAAARIRDLKELDRYTSYVFLLVAVVGLTGAVGSLLASLIASVERKRRSLGVLRLLGLRRRTLFRLPFYQSALVVSLSVGLAVLAWRYVTRLIIEITTASDYLHGEPIQVLPASYLWAAWGGALAIAGAASFFAGLRVMRVDPSEAIRDE